MANSRDKSIILDGPRNAVVRLTGVLDSANESWTPAVSLSDWLNNDQNFGRLVGLRLMRVEYSIGDPLGVILTWSGNTPEQMVNLAQSGDEMSYERYGGLAPDRTRSGYDGGINLVTVGFTPGATRAYSVTLHLGKLYV